MSEKSNRISDNPTATKIVGDLLRETNITTQKIGELMEKDATRVTHIRAVFADFLITLSTQVPRIK